MLFLNGFDSLQEFKQRRSVLLRILEGFMRKVDSKYQVVLKPQTQRAVKFTFKCTYNSPEIEVDLLPSFVTHGTEG